ncbi:hypothetical protein [Portibacter lacus]|uniref:Uncharacterized protein n=1 Tax=Portibacter lacus TaxID=1099794 RepID=A0AA37SRQ9_9BACT|nr:hypothetical protein [Portibacter lacus]GLR18787.1 hypothetical protein GCM10007940_34030 [Portibacter lacus]
MKRVLAILFSVSVLIALSAFAKKEMKTQEELMEEYIQEKLEETRIEEWEKCIRNTIKDAESYVDSIIYTQVNFNIGDTLRAPGKPMKPAKPFDTLRLDSTPIVPIIKKIKE